MKRKLAGIIYADVANYSRLTRSDEEGTHVRLKAHLKQLTDCIVENGGHICHFAGDAVLADFESVVTVLRCAVTAQRDLALSNAKLPETERLEFRIGINLGDVMVDGEEIYGTGVNVAARMEALAEPGGICITGRVFDQVEGIVDVGYEDLGKQQVKNIDYAIRTYKILPDQKSLGKVVARGMGDAARWPVVAVGVAILVFAIGGGFVMWENQQVPVTDVKSANSTTEGNPPVTVEYEGKPVIAVLPFDNFSEAETEEYIVDGLTEDLITALAQHPDLLVIARNSTFHYKGRPVTMQEIRKDLGARYVVEGSVRFSSDTLRVNAQLIDAESGAHLWAQKYDKPRKDLFVLQDELVKAISTNVLPSVLVAEKRRAMRVPTEKLTTYELALRARARKHELTPESLSKSIELLNQVLALDPNFAEAHALMAYANGLLRVFTGSSPEDYAQSLARVHKSLEIDPNQSVGYQAMSQILAFSGRYEESVEAGFQGIQTNPNDAENHIIFSRAASTVGRYREAVESAELAIKLNPFYPKWYSFIYGRALYADGQVDRAADVLGKGMVQQPYLPTGVHGIAALARLGRIDEAQLLTEKILKISPKLTLETVMRNWGFSEASLNSQFETDMLDGGMPKS